ncbi:substrate-binding domain-containing protein [[Clostridium] fimetarium]|uniref:Phosphate transport system substrate-binding protein n=1 Tax=[Clostridium] fimetarium TaxID=99656 RepID=A0A1I0RV11_9FIRM|nr:substrate-binding domain-containing protein [[Clostridium] fimetarium]SEW45232.1 phosphate transport system substrate-binding protein [[Clostridium] fimetarium]
MKVKKVLCTVMGMIMIAGSLVGCGSTAAKPFDASKNITTISREEGSGTRTAFIELFGVQQKDASGVKVDYTYDRAIVTNSTSVMMTSVSSNQYAIGYISLGSLNDTVKAVTIDGIEATVANINSGTYKISRPFNIATKGTLSAVAQDFENYILSSDGQSVIESSGYIKAVDAKAYSGSKPSGSIVIAGSSSVTPVMEKLKEAYLKVNTSAKIEIQESDSTTGMTSAISGICDIGMASRAVSDSEKEKGLTQTTIAIDGLAVIVNKENTTANLTTEAVKNIFMGKTTLWSDIIK